MKKAIIVREIIDNFEGKCCVCNKKKPLSIQNRHQKKAIFQSLCSADHPDKVTVPP